jgi:4-amino-4-deoxy-L-arabinose transferase-like glycosyltransferase
VTIRRAALPAILLVAVCLPMLYALGRWPLMEPDEGRNAEVAREMLVLGDWAVPHFNGLPFLDKPPVLFWSIAASLRLFGPTELAVRLPMVASAACLMLLAYAIARMLLDARAARWALVVVGTAPLVLVFARIAIFDLPFTVLVTAALACLLRTRLTGHGGWLPLAGLAMGLACLTKGPVGFALPLIVWLAARGALAPAPRPAGTAAVVAAVVVFLATVVPWLVLVERAQPDFLHYAVVDETFLRFTSSARFDRSGPIYQPLLAAVGGLGIWTFALVGAATDLRDPSATSAAERTAVRFAIRAAVTIVVFFTLSASKRPGYVLPAIVPLAIVVAVAVTSAGRSAARGVRMAAIGAVIVGLLLAGIAAYPAVIKSMPRGQVRAAIAPAMLTAVATVLLVWGALVTVAARRWPMAPLVLTATLAPALVVVLMGPLQGYAEYRSGRGIAAAIPPDARVLAFRHFRSSLPFYLGRPVTLATVDGHELTSNYISSHLGQFAGHPSLVRPKVARRTIEDTTPLYVVAGSTWGTRFAGAARLRRVTSDRRSTLWVTHD